TRVIARFRRRLLRIHGTILVLVALGSAAATTIGWMTGIGPFAAFISTRDDALGVFASVDGLLAAACSARFRADSDYQSKTLAKINGATIVASDSMMNFGVSILSLPHVIFSFGTAPEYDPKLVVESLI